jgi:hypothetical protein
LSVDSVAGNLFGILIGHLWHGSGIPLSGDRTAPQNALG